MKIIKTFWALVFLLSLAASIAILLPPLKMYCGINVPFVTINSHEFIYFGYTIASSDQWGFMMITALMLAVTGRLVQVSVMKFFKKPEPEIAQDDDYASGYNSMYFYNSEGNRQKFP